MFFVTSLLGLVPSVWLRTPRVKAREKKKLRKLLLKLLRRNNTHPIHWLLLGS